MKGRFRNRFGERVYQGWYRLIYNIVSVVSILPVLAALAITVPPRTVWIIPAPWSYFALAVRLLALLGLGFSLWQTDIWSFLGLRQLVRYLRGEPFPAVQEQFVSKGTYAWVRHPLYFFSMLFIWFNPVMTLSSLLFNLLSTLYFGIGSVYEEQRLRTTFGLRYEEYRSKVPRFLPWPPKSHTLP